MSSRASRRKDTTDVIKKIQSDVKRNEGLARQAFSGLASAEYGNNSSSGGSVSSGGDNLGNHTAIADLNMATYDILQPDRLFWQTDVVIQAVDTTTIDGVLDRLEYNAGNLGGHDFYVDRPSNSTPRFGITETSVESNVPLDMNLNHIAFQSITGVTTPSGTKKRFLFSNSANSDNISVKKPDGSIVDLEGGAGGWDGDATSILDMNNYEIQHTGKISFDVTSGVYPSIDVSADSSVMNFRVNGIGAMALSEASGDPTLEVIGNPNPAIKTRSTDSTPTDNQVIGGLYFDAFNSALSLKTFGSLKMESSDVTSGSEDGAFMMNLMKGGTSTNVLLFDNNKLLPQQTDTYDLGGNANRFKYVSAKYLNNIEQLSFSAAISGQYINSSTAGLQYYVPSGDSHVFEVVSTPVVTMTATETTFADDVIVSGDLTNTTHNDNFTWSGTGYAYLSTTNTYLYSDTTWLGQYGGGDVCRIAATLNFTDGGVGTHQTLPTQSDGYINIQVGGIARKLYYYN